MKDLENLSTNIHYHHIDDDYFARMRAATVLIDTPYVAVLADDDLFLTAGLKESIRRLEFEPNLFGVVGRAAYFFFQRGNVFGHQTHSLSSNYPDDVDDGISRLNNLLLGFIAREVGGRLFSRHMQRNIHVPMYTTHF
jgi:hypothetical protein